MFFLYQCLWFFALPFVWLFFQWKGRKNRAYAKRFKERFGFYDKKFQPQGIVIHAASVGEVMVAEGLIQQLLKNSLNIPLTVTTMTPTGSALVKQKFGNKVQHCYLPFDFCFFVKRFLKKVQPQLFIIIETEIWANLFSQLKKQHIPLVIANARLSERSFKRYGYFKKTMVNIFESVDLIAAQDKLSGERYLKLGAKNVRITGNLKYDFSHLPNEERINLYRQIIHQRPTWVAASTHEGEEEIILNAHRLLQQKLPELLLVLVPRHLERFETVAQLISQSGFSFTKRSLSPKKVNEEVLLVDAIGELMSVFAVSDVVLMGGSLISRGGHNPLEPLAENCAVLSGREIFNFKDIYRQLDAEHAVTWVDNTSESVAKKVFQLLMNKQECHQYAERGKGLLQQNRGALSQLWQALQPFWEKLK